MTTTDEKERSPPLSSIPSYLKQGVPVTPDPLSAGANAYQQPKVHTPHWNANSYFAPKPGEQNNSARRPSSPAELAKGVRTGAELLRRLSLTGLSKPDVIADDPQKQYPGLNLSGSIISASFCIPHKVAYRFGGGWSLDSRRGTSALYDNFTHLASKNTPFNHTLVGWVGEIDKPLAASSPEQLTPTPRKPSAQSSIGSHKDPSIPISQASAPIPVDGTKRTNVPNDTLVIPKADREELENLLREDGSGSVVPIWLHDESEKDGDDLKLKNQSRWRRYAEQELYTLFHYKQHAPDDGRAERKWWADYVRLNHLFAKKILSIYKPGDIVWIHDYHLLLLPHFLRQRVPDMYIGLFIHVPFPSSEYLRCLRRRKDILQGCLGATMVGFQSFSYSRHFSSCCQRILGYTADVAGVDAQGLRVFVDVFPIGIDTTAVQKAAYTNPVVEEKSAGIKAMYAGKKIIVGRDRLDSVRGVAQKLQAFEKFLERYPEWRDKVVLIQVTSPTSVEWESESEEHDIANKISDLVSRINGRFGSLSFAPVQHYPQYLSPDEYFALLRIADLALNTSVRDGMNTASLEYIVCQKDHYGPLILSEFSGTAGNLTDALHINPWDLGGVADMINRALTMPPAEKKQLHQKLYEHVTTNTVSKWSNTFVRRLLINLQSVNQNIITPELDRSKVIAQYKRTHRRLFMFDYDGTLTPIVKEPSAAIPSDRILRTVKKLAADPQNAVWIISGRDRDFLAEWMGHIPELGLSAEHGCFMRPPRSETWDNLAAALDMAWQAEAYKIFEYYCDRAQGSWIERKTIAVTWHYRKVQPELGEFMARMAKEELEKSVATKWEVEVMAGKANLEIRPRFLNKGYIVERLLNEYNQKPEFVMSAGDDMTDEGTYPFSAFFLFSKCLHILIQFSYRHVSLPDQSQAS